MNTLSDGVYETIKTFSIMDNFEPLCPHSSTNDLLTYPHKTLEAFEIQHFLFGEGSNAPFCVWSGLNVHLRINLFTSFVRFFSCTPPANGDGSQTQKEIPLEMMALGFHVVLPGK